MWVNPRPLRCRPLKAKKKPEIRPENGLKQREDVRDAGVYIAVSGGVKPTVPRLVIWDAAICSMGDLPPSQQAIRRFCIAQNRIFLRFLIRNALLAKLLSSPNRIYLIIFSGNRFLSLVAVFYL